MAETIEELDNLCSGHGSQALLEILTKRNKQMIEDGRLVESDDEKKDTRQLFKMAMAGVGSDDPEFCRRRGETFEKTSVYLFVMS
jgi:uncharacterized protein (UPF0303 family)